MKVIPLAKDNSTIPLNIFSFLGPLVFFNRNLFLKSNNHSMPRSLRLSASSKGFIEPFNVALEEKLDHLLHLIRKEPRDRRANEKTFKETSVAPMK